MFFLDVRIGFDSVDQAKRFFSSIKPEFGEEFLRSKTKVILKEGTLEFKISASDKPALRASLNAFLKPLLLFIDLEELG